MVEPLGGSFRDPSGFVFENKGVLLRQVNPTYAGDLELLFGSGLHDELVGSRLLVSAERVGAKSSPFAGAYDVLQPERIPFISYPYEWCFGQLRDAALLTLELCRKALDHGMVLKDASAYNVQFVGGRPVFIDTLSFETYQEGEPWIAYRQFCRHFLAPLALMALTDIRLGLLLRDYVDGVPLPLATRLLPFSARFKSGLGMHLYLHARVDKPLGESEKGGSQKADKVPPKISKVGLLALLDSLRTAVRALQWKAGGTEWADYYSDNNYTDEGFAEKKRLVGSLAAQVLPKPMMCWDLGGNSGEFAQIAGGAGAHVVSLDVDPAAVEMAYRKSKSQADRSLVCPILMDFTNPSPSQGWMGKERQSLFERGPADLVLALAIVHHLAIGNNVPLASIGEFLAASGTWAIVEFVPKEDSQVKRMLAGRRDIFPDYSEAGFEAAVGNRLEIMAKHPIPGTVRVIYLLKRPSL